MSQNFEKKLKLGQTKTIKAWKRMQKRIQIFVEGAQPTIVGLLAGCVIVIGLNWSILSAKRAQAAKTLWVSFIYLFDLSWLNYQSFAVRALALTKSQASPYANPNTDNAERYIDVRLGVVCVRVVHGTAQFDEQHFERCWRHYMGRTRCWDRTLRPLGPSGMSWQDGMDGSDRFLAATTHGSLEPKRHWQNHVMLIKILSMYACSTQKVAGCLTKQPGKTVIGSGRSFDVAMALQD